MARITPAPDRLEGYTQSKPRISTLPPIPCCDHCRRPSSNPHAPECPLATEARTQAGGTLAEWAEQQKRRRAEPPIPSPVYGPEPDEPAIACAECGQDLPMHRRKYCGDRCSRVAFARVAREKRREETAPVTTTTEATAICRTCGPQPRDAFASKINGAPYANCNLCRKAHATAMAAKRFSPKAVTPIPQEVADVAYAAMTQAPDPEDMIPTKPVQRFLPEPAVIDQAAPAPMPAEPFEEIEQLPPIEDEVARAEQQLADLRDIRKIMEDELPALLRWQRLVGEAIARKGGA